MKYCFISKYKPNRLAFKKACQAVCVSPSGYFKSLKGFLKPLSLMEKKVLSVFYTHKGLYGYRKISHYLENTGISCSEDKVRRILS